MRVDNYLSEYAGIDLESEVYMKAIRCLSQMFLGKDGIFKPDDDLVEVYHGEVDWAEEAKEFREIFSAYLNDNRESVREFLYKAGVSKRNTKNAIKDLENFFDIDGIDKDTDIFPYIEEYFDGNLDEAIHAFLGMYQH